MTDKKADDIRNMVRDNYAKVARQGAGCGCEPSSSCCDPKGLVEAQALKLGYSEKDAGIVPEGANMGLGCGNPQQIAKLKPGETVLDLGAGGGFDCFLAGRAVGDTGRVIGVDMTPEMVAKARDNARRAGVANVGFRLGEIEHLPVADSTIDVILSNCVINLSPDKKQVYADAFRVLKPGGRLAIADTVKLKEMPEAMTSDPKMLCGCATGAASAAEIVALLENAGFTDIRVDVDQRSREVIKEWLPGSGVENYLASTSVEAIKPAK